MEIDSVLASSDWVIAGGIFLILIGISFLILEFFIPSFGLFGFAGVVAVLIGIIQLHQAGYIEELPVNINVLIGGIIVGIALSAWGGWYSWKLYKKKNTTGVEAMIGETARILKWKDKEGRIHFQGEDWMAYSDTALDLKKDDEAIISAVKGLKIKIISK